MSAHAATPPLPATAPATLPLPDGTLSRARRATRVQFGALGIIGGAWGVHIPSVKAQYGLGEGTLAVVLLAAAVGALLSLLFAGRVIARLGVQRTTALAMLILCGMLALVLQWPGMALLLPAMVVFGAAMSQFDVAINAEGTALESLGGRAVMGQLHGMFSLGGMAGAALGAALLRAGVTAPQQLLLIPLLMAVVSLLASRGMLPAHAHHEEGGQDQAHFAWPRGPLLVIGLLIFAGMTAEGVMYDWSVLYLKQEVGMPQDRAALGYAAFSAAMAAARFGGDALRARFAERLLLRRGALLAGVAMAVVLLSGQPELALPGYVCVGAGLALVVPILYNAATRVPGTSRAAAIASVSSIGYSGFLVGPPLIGGIAHATSLTVAMALIVVAAGLLALGARRV
ncbi:fucose permease [Sphaerotilus hippei]|uniref:Fucose permease n=1 Tax=Sphaerotilus hippei TaxID=744406 RepID=A0A318HH87_9BURK|nr:MFS transporter [Sphaerotilus hippei]PXW99423.1 fucose permease [Sphaerotilus hippei]